MWNVQWSFLFPFPPGERPIQVQFKFTNPSRLQLALESINFAFSFGAREFAVRRVFPPGTSDSLPLQAIRLPAGVSGTVPFSVTTHVKQWTGFEWLPLPAHRESGHTLAVPPRTVYRIFVSRGLHPEDRIVGDPIVDLLHLWGLQTRTVGIEVVVPSHMVHHAVEDEIRKADGVFVIATPRHRDSVSGLWKTLEWLHGEVGIAFGKGKPILIAREEGVDVGALPGALADHGEFPAITFDRRDIKTVRRPIAGILPAFRDCLGKRRTDQAWKDLKNLALGITAVVGGVTILDGLAGHASSSRKRSGGR